MRGIFAVFISQGRLSLICLIPVLFTGILCHTALAAEPEMVITEPVSIAQYDDAVVVYLHGFDVARTRYPSLELEYRLIFADGSFGDTTTLDLSKEWEKPSIILRKDDTEYAGIVISASGGANVFFRRLYSLNGTLDPQTLVTTLAQNAVIESGQFLEGAAPVIPQPDLATFDTVTVGAAGRTVIMDPNTYQAKSSINYPLVDAGNNGPLSLQTDFPGDLSKRSLYVVLKFQLYDQTTGDPGEVRRVLCEVPLNSDWLNGTEDLVINLEPSDIKVHATDQQFEGVHILPRGLGGLGQSTGTMARGTDFKIYWSNAVPSQIVRFDPVTAEWELPPVSVKDLMYDDRPTREEALGETGNTNKVGHYGSYRMIWSMNNITPARMVFSSVQNRRFEHGFFWGGMWTVPQDHWDDPVAFAANFHFPVAAWPTAPHDFWDVLPTIGGPNYRLWQFPTYGNTIYARPYPNSVGGPWRVDLNTDGSVDAFGTEASGVFPDFDDYVNKPVDATPFNAAGKITFTNYGVLNMTRTQLKDVITGIRDTSLSGDIEVNYDAIEHMLQTPSDYEEILDNIGGPSLAPGYMVTHLPGQDGQALAAAEYGYYLSQFDMNTPTPGEVNKTYLELDSADPTLELPLKVGLGPYGHQWTNINGDDWLYVSGYIGMTRFKYSSNGVPLQRFTMDKFDTRLSRIDLDGSSAIAGGAIKRYRYIQHGIDDLMFVTGTHTAPRGGTAFSGGLMSFDKTQLDTRWKLSYMSRCYNTVRLRNRIVREADGSLLQELCHIGYFNSDYVHTIPAEHVPANSDPKIFCYDYPSGGTMRDRMGFSTAPLNGSGSISDLAYSRDRRYLLVMQGNGHLLTFDPQTNRYIDGKQLTFGSEFHSSDANRPGHRLLRAPDDRLFLYAAASDAALNATFIEVQVSPSGELSFNSHAELQFATSDDRKETFDSTFAYLPDYASDDGSYDLLLGQNYSNPDTDLRLIEDFIPPRSHNLTRSLNLLSTGINGATISGSKPGTTPFRADCSNGENVTLTSASAINGHLFQEWQDEDGNTLGTASSLQLGMSEDRIITAVYDDAPTNMITISPAVKSIDDQSQNYAITVSSNTSWSVSAPPLWASVDPTSGSGNGQITVTVQANGSTDARNGSFTIGDKTHSLTQQGIPPLGSVPGVSASDNTFSEKIRIDWSALNLAENYHIYRATTDEFGQATELAQAASGAAGYEDTSAVAGSVYYYWVLGSKANTGLGPEGLSNPGERAEDTGGDSADEASALIFSNGASTQAGNLEAGDNDWYKFSVSPGRYVTVHTTGTLDTIGSIYRADDSSSPLNPVEADDNEGDGENFQIYEMLATGDYFAKVSGAGDDQSGSYQLHISMDTIANYFPDLWTGPKRSRMKGNDSYSLSGAGQTFSITRRRQAVCYMRAQNDGNTPERLRIQGSRDNRNFRFNCYRLTGGRANVSGSVARGTFLTRLLEPAEVTDFQIKVSPKFRKGLTKRTVMRIRVFSVIQSFRQDVGKPVITIKR